MTLHSPLVGGSSAERLLNCPGSYRLIMNLPELSETASEAATEGTYLHHVMDALLNARVADSTTDLKEEAKIWLGDSFYDRTLQQRDLDELIYPALDALAELEEHYGGGFKVIGVEQTFDFPGIPGAFGTIDLTLANEHYVIVLDYKFGVYEVKTAYMLEDGGEILNPQLAFYCCAALNSKPKIFKGRHIVAAVIQPRGEIVLDHTVVERDELRRFAEDLVAAAGAALGRDAVTSRGRWCRFCPAKPTCPEWTGPLLKLAMVPDHALSPLNYKTRREFGEFLSRAKDFSELVADYAKEVDRQLVEFLETGGEVPGWGLIPKKKLRQWIDDATVEAELKKLGFKPEEIWQKKLATFAAADAAAKRRGKKIPDHLRVAPVTDEVVPARIGPKIVVDKSTVIGQLQSSVALLESRKGDGEAADQS